MTTFAPELRRARENGWYQNREDLSARAGISKRSLELAEAGSVVPSVGTLEKLLRVMGLPVAEAQRLRLLRDQAQAARDRFSLPERDDLQVPRIADAAAAEAAFYFRKRHYGITDSEVAVLRAKLHDVIKGILAPAQG